MANIIITGFVARKRSLNSVACKISEKKDLPCNDNSCRGMITVVIIVDSDDGDTDNSGDNGDVDSDDGDTDSGNNGDRVGDGIGDHGNDDGDIDGDDGDGANMIVVIVISDGGDDIVSTLWESHISSLLYI